jgi:hypothetical protein
MKIRIENRWNDDRIKQKFTEKIMPKWHFVRNKSHMDCQGIEPDLGGWNLA